MGDLMPEERFKTDLGDHDAHPRDGSLRDAAVTLLAIYDKLGDKTTVGRFRIGQAKTMAAAALRRIGNRVEVLDGERRPEQIATAIREALEEIEGTEEEW
jgi:ribosome biogenesis SPOUT family RNA methylase Rps3